MDMNRDESKIYLNSLYGKKLQEEETNMIKNLQDNETISLYFTNYDKGHKNYPYIDTSDFLTIIKSLTQDHNYLLPKTYNPWWSCMDINDVINELINLNTADNYITMIVNTQIPLF